jgi:hypothetical protein
VNTVRTLVLVFLLALAVLAPSGASASPYVQYGLQDDAWLENGPGALDARLDRLQSLGVDLVRLTLDWNATEPTRGTYDWSTIDPVLQGLHDRNIQVLLTLYGTPGWANGGKAENWAPNDRTSFASFAATVAKRYPFVKKWGIWNEPNQRRWLRPTSPTVYTQLLLNPAYAAIHRASPGSEVAGGATAPRGSTGGVSPLSWLAGMALAHARLDAYAHNPYPLDPGETPTSGGCGHCSTVTMATLDRLLTAVKRAFGPSTRIWLTEYGYQTNPPDRFLGVSYAAQARYLAEAALKAYASPRVDVLVQYLVEDEPNTARWQSGLLTDTGLEKPAYEAFRFPLAERSRTGLATTLWGQVRPGGEATYVLQRDVGGSWHAVGSAATTTTRGYLQRTVRAGPGARFRLYVPSEHASSTVLTVG